MVSTDVSMYFGFADRFEDVCTRFLVWSRRYVILDLRYLSVCIRFFKTTSWARSIGSMEKDGAGFLICFEGSTDDVEILRLEGTEADETRDGTVNVDSSAKFVDSAL
ncbi:hypothetical protein OGAPHI_000711 [Ogataea philodendri]|uniref:Uncharacterized protein n=1 Tax=Ogataea philodendri TaxID=1378263 RepID=A0A9P8TA53_9ASCO|nr:uncharacterized protein OGAPHI_000711 [Ogataea philodendri]KAH3671000.1 hypothetical protein OGAPHI_000711 [Ogataea philodendri]